MRKVLRVFAIATAVVVACVVALFVAFRTSNDPAGELRLAVFNGDLGAAKQILDAHPEVIDSAANYQHRSGGFKDLAILKIRSLARGPIATIDFLGWNPMDVAVERGNIEMIKLLLERGADANRRRPDGFPPLHVSINRKNMAVIEAFIEKRKGLESQNHYSMTALGWAVSVGDARIVEALIKAGADVNGGAANPLLCAVRGKNESLVETLIQHGARVNLADTSSTAPLPIARQLQVTNIVRLLEEAGGRQNN